VEAHVTDDEVLSIVEAVVEGTVNTTSLILRLAIASELHAQLLRAKVGISEPPDHPKHDALEVARSGTGQLGGVDVVAAQQGP
jgi:hypothetical protein